MHMPHKRTRNALARPHTRVQAQSTDPPRPAPALPPRPLCPCPRPPQLAGAQNSAHEKIAAVVNELKATYQGCFPVPPRRKPRPSPKPCVEPAAPLPPPAAGCRVTPVRGGRAGERAPRPPSGLAPRPRPGPEERWRARTGPPPRAFPRFSEFGRAVPHMGDVQLCRNTTRCLCTTSRTEGLRGRPGNGRGCAPRPGRPEHRPTGLPLDRPPTLVPTGQRA